MLVVTVQKVKEHLDQLPDKVPSNLTKAQVETALHGYKDGSYGGAQKMLMKGQVMSLSDAQIKEIAAYIGK